MQLTIIVLFALIPSITTLKCYVCNSLEQRDCANEGKLGKFEKQCTQTNEPYCRKIVQTIDKDTSIVRTCGSHIGTKACYKTAGLNSANVCSCNTDLCNNAPNFNRQQQMMIILSSIVVMAITMIVLR